MPTPEDLSQADIDEMAATFREAMKPHEPEPCPATGALNVNGEVVAVVPCMLEAGHDQPTFVHAFGEGLTQPVEYEPGTPHAWGIEWTDPPRRLVAVVVDEGER